MLSVRAFFKRVVPRLKGVLRFNAVRFTTQFYHKKKPALGGLVFEEQGFAIPTCHASLGNGAQVVL